MAVVAGLEGGDDRQEDEREREEGQRDVRPEDEIVERFRPSGMGEACDDAVLERVVGEIRSKEERGGGNRREHRDDVRPLPVALDEADPRDDENRAQSVEARIDRGKVLNSHAVKIRSLLFEQTPDVADDFLHPALGGAFVEAANRAGLVQEDQAGGVGDGCAFRCGIGDGQFKAIARQGIDVVFFASQEKPMLARFETLGVCLQHFRCVLFRIDGDRDEPHIGFGTERFLHVAEAAREHRARTGTGRVKKISDPDFAGEVGEADRLAAALGEREIGERPVFRQDRGRRRWLHDFNGGVVFAALIFIEVFIALPKDLRGGPIGALLLGVFLGLVFYIMGVVVSARGQMLQASLDTAVNTSPLLDNRRKIEIMSLR